MGRRRFCAAKLSGLLSGLAGCNAGAFRAPKNHSSARTTEQIASPAETVSLAETGQPPDICEAEIIEGFSINAIVGPAFSTDWVGCDVESYYLRNETDEDLADDAAVVGREHNGHARAYPISILWHTRSSTTR